MLSVLLFSVRGHLLAQSQSKSGKKALTKHVAGEWGSVHVSSSYLHQHCCICCSLRSHQVACQGKMASFHTLVSRLEESHNPCCLGRSHRKARAISVCGATDLLCFILGVWLRFKSPNLLHFIFVIGLSFKTPNLKGGSTAWICFLFQIRASLC